MASAGVGRRLGDSDAKEEPAIEVVEIFLANGNDAKALGTRGENVLHGVAFSVGTDCFRCWSTQALRSTS